MEQQLSEYKNKVTIKDDEVSDKKKDKQQRGCRIFYNWMKRKEKAKLVRGWTAWMLLSVRRADDNESKLEMQDEIYKM